MDKYVLKVSLQGFFTEKKGEHERMSCQSKER